MGSDEDLDADSEADEKAKRREALRNVTLSGAVASLKGLIEGKGTDSQEFYEAWMQLAHLIEARPEVVDQIESMVVNRAVTDDLESSMLTALGAAGTDRAQDALMNFRSNRSLPEATRSSATIGMIQLAKPKTELLSSMARDLRDSTDMSGHDSDMLVLGTLAPRNDDPVAGGQDAFTVLMGLEAKATQANKLPVWLSALGNTSRAEILPKVQPYLTHELISVREAAVYALNKVEGLASLPGLLIAVQDKSSRVRITALEGLAKRDSDKARLAIATAAQSDPDQRVRDVARRLQNSKKKNG